MKQFFVILSITLTSFTAFSQSKLPDPQPYFVAIIVSDIDNSIQWYSDNFGFDVLNKVDFSDRGFKQANLKRETALIELIEIDNSLAQDSILDNQPPKTKIQGFFKFGFTVADLDQWVSFLTDADVELYGSIVRDDNTGQRMIIIKDPDGNRIQLFEE